MINHVRDSDSVRTAYSTVFALVTNAKRDSQFFVVHLRKSGIRTGGGQSSRWVTWRGTAGRADSIWLKIVDEELRSVDSKKLVRAEKLRELKKQQKKDAAGLRPVANKYGSREATAS